ncbi:MAG: S9 family peptidase [Candidatus Obscuribacterales bacterium]|nr:S9 family peptidase [Candidatus Obscuribacterales bacterium]
MSKECAYGAWDSPISSDLVASANIRLSHCTMVDGDCFWLESRPAEKGRCVVVCRDRQGKTFDVNPAPFSVRSNVHEYGGGEFAIVDGCLYFNNLADQRIYRQPLGGKPEAISEFCSSHFADFCVDKNRNRLIVVREDYSYGEGEPINSLDCIKLDGQGGVETLLTGSDFFSSPKVSPDGRLLAWLTWNHPHMPWDETKLWIGNLGNDGSLSNVQQVAGGSDESIYQPEWGSDGTLYYVSDKNGFWNLYSWFYGENQILIEMEAEFAVPHWIFAQNTYSIDAGKRIICAFNRKGEWKLGEIDLETKKFSQIETAYSDITFVKVENNFVIFRAGSPTEFSQIVRLNLQTKEIEVLRLSNDISMDKSYFSIAESIEFENKHKQKVYAFYYPPKNPDFIAPTESQPPLIVFSHGGPTAACSNTLELEIQYWTSRGFAAVDVNYGGSTGYGKAYQKRLHGQWGIVDVDDCIAAADYLCQANKADHNRLIICGGSAGGFTTLCALTFRDKFKAGASYYGISDLEGLTEETHKFEAHYNDRMIGPYPEQKQIYKERSPINYPEKINCPVIFFQGLKDKVVPPSQSETLVQALRQKKLPVAYLTFPDEGHGFRQAETIKQCLEAELYFYCQIFKIKRHDLAEVVTIENL